MRRVEPSEVPLAGAEPYGHHVDQSKGQGLPADIAGCHCNVPFAGELLCDSDRGNPAAWLAFPRLR